MAVSSQPTYPNCAVEKGTYRGRSNRFLHVWFLGLAVTASSVGVCDGEEYRGVGDGNWGGGWGFLVVGDRVLFFFLPGATHLTMVLVQ